VAAGDAGAPVATEVDEDVNAEDDEAVEETALAAAPAAPVRRAARKAPKAPKAAWVGEPLADGGGCKTYRCGPPVALLAARRTGGCCATSQGLSNGREPVCAEWDVIDPLVRCAVESPGVCAMHLGSQVSKCCICWVRSELHARPREERRTASMACRLAPSGAWRGRAGRRSWARWAWRSATW